MSPDGRVLEANLERLLRRAYVPALPRPEFRRAALGLARDEVHGRRRGGPGRILRFALPAAAAAAAVCAVWIGLRGGAAPAPAPTAAGIVARGDAAVRIGGEGDWRAATAEEQAAGLMLAADAVEVETPSALGLAALAEDARAALAPASRARFAELPDAAFGAAGPGCGAELAVGEVSLALGPRADTWWLSTEAGLVRVAPDSALDARRAGGRTTVQLAHGRAVLERADGSQVSIEAGAPVALDGDRLTPVGAGGGRQPVDSPQVEALVSHPLDGAQGAVPTPDTAPPAGATVRGRVRDAAGAPVARFRVLLLREAEVPDVAEPLLKDFESADGAFAWDGVPPERYELFVEAPGFAPHRSGVLELAAAEPLELDVLLAAGRTLRGWVLELETEVPLPGATVVDETDMPSQLLPYDLTEPPEWLQRLATAGPDGGFTLPDLRPGTHRLRVGAPDHAPEWVSVEVPAGGAVPDAFVHLGPGGGVAGIVEDAHGRPLPGSLLLATITGVSAFTYQQTVTDAEGRYAFEHLAPSMHMLIRWDSAEQAERGGDLDDLRPVMIARGKVVTVDFRADQATLRISGRFLDADGKPIPLQKFTLVKEEANSLDNILEWQAEIADHAGAYEVEVPEPGTYLVFATYGMGHRLSLVDAIELEEGVSELVRDVRVPRTRVLCTVLRADDRRPVSDALVFALKLDAHGEQEFAGRTIADAAGVAVLDGLPPGRYFFVAASADATDLGQAATPAFDLAAGEESHALELQLPEGGVLRVRAVDRTGKPVEGAHLELRSERDKDISLLVEPFTGPDGRISIPGLSPGVYSVTAESEGFAPAAASAEVRAALGADLLIQLVPLD